MKSRLKLPEPSLLTPAQQLVFEDIVRTRGNVEGPFLAWLLSPGLADPAQKLGAFCRFGTTLSHVETELLILYVAAHYACTAEQQIHEPIAQKAGLSSELIAAIRTGGVPPLATSRQRLLADVTIELLDTKTLQETTYSKASSQLGEVTLVEVVGVIGYYAMVAYTLNAFSFSVS